VSREGVKRQHRPPRPRQARQPAPRHHRPRPDRRHPERQQHHQGRQASRAAGGRARPSAAGWWALGCRRGNMSTEPGRSRSAEPVSQTAPYLRDQALLSGQLSIAMHSAEHGDHATENSVLCASSGPGPKGMFQYRIRRVRTRLSQCWPTACPVSLNMRHGERHYYLRCLKYARQSPPSVVSPTMRHVRKPFALSYQVRGAGA